MGTFIKQSNTLVPVSVFQKVESSTQVPYLTFSSSTAFSIEIDDFWVPWDGTLEYSVDLQTWTTWGDGTGTLYAALHNNLYCLYLRGTNNTIITGGLNSSWRITGSSVHCDGNIEMLLDYQTAMNGQHPIMESSCFAILFENNSGLISAPELPAVTLSSGCYFGMFAGCSGLNTLPLLPATTLVDGCYSGMFDRCTNIKLSTTQTGDYQTPYRIPTTGSGSIAAGALDSMFSNTGGTFTGTPSINTTYYTSNTVVTSQSNYSLQPLNLTTKEVN